MQKFLFVCTGNTCRSPLAQALLKAKRPDIEVKSAGVNALPGMDASEGTLEVLKEKGITFEHSTNLVSDELMKWADIILTLTQSHKETLIKQFPVFVDKIHTLKEFAFEKELEDTHQLLQHHYAQLELKQAQFLQTHKAEIEQLNKQGDLEAQQQLEKLSNKLQELLKEDQVEITKLEKKMPSLDISDPFGGSVEVYRKIAGEIEKAIELILKKL